MVTCPNCGRVQREVAGPCENCGAMLGGWTIVADMPLAEELGLDRLTPDSQLTRELTGPLRELAGHHCSACGASNRPGALFCANCGNSMLDEATNNGVAVRVPERPAAPGQLLPGTLLHGQYRIDRKVAQGGMGAVYEVHDEQKIGSRLAIKEMAQTALSNEERTQALKDFMREVTILATLEHPNLPQFDGFFSENGNHYLVMEFIQGQTLETILGSSRDFLTERRVIIWAAQLCSVIEHLHMQEPPIIYRDCKPGNVMLIDGSDNIKLIDFGIARFHRQGKINDSIAFGTAGYAPPEQYGNAQTDQRSDIYALGATLHHLLSGHDPGENPFHWKPLRYYNPRISRRVDQAIMQAVNLKPEERFQTIGEFARALGLLPKTNPEPVKISPAASEPQVHKNGATRSHVETPPKIEPPQPAPKPLIPAEPASSPRIAISEEAIELAPGRKAKRSKQVNLVNVGGGQLTGSMKSDVPWLGLSAQQFSGNTAEITVTADRRGLKTGHLDFKVPNLFAEFRKGLGEWPLRVLVFGWVLLFLTQGSVLGANGLSEALFMAVLGGLGVLAGGQLLLWLVARHVRWFVPAPKQNIGQVIVDSNGGTRQISVRVLARPGWPRLALGWVIAGLLLGGELFLLARLLYRVLLE